jgi:hypothetical protein
MNMKLLLENWRKHLDILEQESKEGGKEFKLSLPRLHISEQWGSPGSSDREIIEMFTAQIQGSTLHEKIASLNSFISNCDKACANTKDVSEILGNLVFLDSLAAVIRDFNASTAGFLFESLISALLGAGAQQVPTTGGLYQDTTDVIDNQGRPLSLKFYKLDPDDPKGYITGAKPNLRAAIRSHGQPMIYLLGLKSTKDKKVNSVEFYEISIGSKQDGIEAQFDVDNMNIPIKMIVKGQVYVQKEFPNGKFHPMAGNARKNRYFIGALKFGSREDLVKIAQNYADRLGTVLLDIYEQLEKLTTNVNVYFLEEDKAAAVRAKEHAAILKAETEELT